MDESENKPKGLVDTAASLKSAQDFVPISREDLIVMSPLPADFYVRLSDQNFVLVGRKGSPKLQDLQVVKGGSVQELYVLREEFKDCVGINIQIAEVAIGRSEISDPKKISFLLTAGDSVFKEIHSLGFNRDSMIHAQVVANSIMALVSAKQDLNDVVVAMSGVSGELMRHSLAVSAISVVIAREMNWTVLSTLQKLALAGLLHDIGLKEINPEILRKPRHVWSVAEVKEYESHVLRSVQILQSMPSVPSEVIAVAMEHHENAIGQGYPKHLRDIKINPFSRVVALANAFCELVLPDINNPQPRTAAEAIQYMGITLGQPYSKPAFQALKKSLELDAKKKSA